MLFLFILRNMSKMFAKKTINNMFPDDFSRRTQAASPETHNAVYKYVSCNTLDYKKFALTRTLQFKCDTLVEYKNNN